MLGEYAEMIVDFVTKRFRKAKDKNKSEMRDLVEDLWKFLQQEHLRKHELQVGQLYDDWNDFIDTQSATEELQEESINMPIEGNHAESEAIMEAIDNVDGNAKAQADADALFKAQQKLERTKEELAWTQGELARTRGELTKLQHEKLETEKKSTEPKLLPSDRPAQHASSAASQKENRTKRPEEQGSTAASQIIGLRTAISPFPEPLSQTEKSGGSQSIVFEPLGHDTASSRKRPRKYMADSSPGITSGLDAESEARRLDRPRLQSRQSSRLAGAHSRELTGNVFASRRALEALGEARSQQSQTQNNISDEASSDERVNDEVLPRQTKGRKGTRPKKSREARLVQYIFVVPANDGGRPTYRQLRDFPPHIADSLVAAIVAECSQSDLGKMHFARYLAKENQTRSLKAVKCMVTTVLARSTLGGLPRKDPSYCCATCQRTPKRVCCFLQMYEQDGYSEAMLFVYPKRDTSASWQSLDFWMM